MRLKPNNQQQELSSIRKSRESYLHWKKHFHKNALYFRIHADLEADIEFDNSSIGDKTNNIYKRNPNCNGFCMECELNNVLKNRYYESPVGYDNVNWFVDEVIKFAIKMNFYFKNTNEIIIMTKEYETEYRNIFFC